MDMSDYDGVRVIEYLKREAAREEREHSEQQAVAGDQNAIDIDDTVQGEITDQIVDADQLDHDFPQPVHAVDNDEIPAEKKGKPGRKKSGKTKDLRTTLLFPEELWRDLRDLAHAAGTTPNAIVNDLIRDTTSRNGEIIEQYRRLNRKIQI